MIDTLPRQELTRRLRALIGRSGVPNPPNQLQLTDVARYIGRSLALVRQLAYARRDYTDVEQIRLSQMFQAVDRGEIKVVKSTEGSRDMHRGVAVRPSVPAPRPEHIFGFEFTPGGPRLKAK